MYSVFTAIKIVSVWCKSPPSLMDTNVSEEPAYCIIRNKVFLLCEMEATGFCETLVPIYKIVPYHIPEDHYFIFLG